MIAKIILCSAVILGPFAANIGLAQNFDGLDQSRKKITAKMSKVLSGFDQPTAIQFIPNDKKSVLVLEKQGKLIAASLDSSKKYTLHQFSVVFRSEMGLLSAALHPKFPQDNRIFVHYNPKIAKNKKKRISRISSFPLLTSKKKYRLGKEKIILEQAQPYNNHNGGQIAFGPDGHLFIGFGDGGSADDPKNAGQQLNTLLGKILRVDINTKAKPYLIPPDNPFIKTKNALPEIFAYGLRNPWRFSFAPTGELIVADVGQNAWEEVTVVSIGQNHGWRVFEGTSCYLDQKMCKKIVHTPPSLVYGRSDGTSITGGFAYQGTNKRLKKHYIFGDFTSGRIWSVPMKNLLQAGAIKTDAFRTLGRWPFNISSFGQDYASRTYVVDFTGGDVYRID